MKTYEEYAAECPLVAILRGVKLEETEAVCDALYDGGIRLLEITLNTANALESIDSAVKYTAGRQLVGAGTVLKPEEVDQVAKHGGKFIISPNTDPADLFLSFLWECSRIVYHNCPSRCKCDI